MRVLLPLLFLLLAHGSTAQDVIRLRYIHANTNVREAPSRDSTIVAELVRGDLVQLGECASSWCAVERYMGGGPWSRGFIHQSLLHSDPPATATTRSASPRPAARTQTRPSPAPRVRSGRPPTVRSTSAQCTGTTQRGARCRNLTRSPNGRCWQHGGN